MWKEKRKERIMPSLVATTSALARTTCVRAHTLLTHQLLFRNHLSVSNDGMQDLLNDEFEIEEENNNREAIEDEQADGAVPSEVKSGRGRLRTGKHGKGKDDTGAGGEGGEEVNPIIFKYMCENKYCKDFGKVFQFASEIRRHVK